MATTTLYGNTWVGDSEPSTGVTACQEWIQVTSGDKFYRNTSNSAWIENGNVNNPLGGAVHDSGDTLTGPLSGATNLAALDGADFTGALTVNGFPVALESDLAAFEKTMYDYVTRQIRQQFLSQYQQSSTAADIAYTLPYESVAPSSIESPNSFSIPYALFPDGTQATPAQELGYGWALLGISFGLSTNYEALVEVTAGTATRAPGSRHLALIGTPGGGDSTVDFIWWSFAVR